MPNEPGTEQQTTPDPATAALAELKQMKAALAAERETLQREREGMSTLTESLVGLVRSSAPKQEPAPPEELPSADDFENDRIGAVAKLSAAQIKQALRSYHEAIAPEIESMRAGLAEVEWERTRTEDSKNFSRLEPTMRKYFKEHPEALRPGAVKDIFYRLRGIHFSKLQEMDRTEGSRATEPVADPAPTAGSRGKKPEADALSKNEIGAIRGLRIDPRHYFLAKHSREPNFEKGYLGSLGFQEQTK